MNDEKIRKGAKFILEGLGVDTNDRNFVKTPQRFLDALKEFFVPPTKAINLYEEAFNGWVITRNHLAYTLCPHHLLPVKMLISAVYVPAGNVIGLSKVPRMFSLINDRPSLQEQLTNDFAEMLSAIRGCQGAAVIIKGQHMCMQARGIRSSGWVITTARRGLLVDPQVFQCFLSIVKTEDEA